MKKKSDPKTRKKVVKKKAGRPKGSRGPLKRYLDYLLGAKKIESYMKVYTEADGWQVTKRGIASKVDIGHEVMFTLIHMAIVERDIIAIKELLNRMYGRVPEYTSDDPLTLRGDLLNALDSIVDHSRDKYCD